MEKSESIAKLTEALSKAQAEFRPAKKKADNPFYKSRYADLVEIMDVCRRPLTQNGLAVMQVVELDEEKMFLVTVLSHLSGEWISSKYPLRPMKLDPQSLGSALTYSRRYALQALVGVVSEDEDDDGNAASGITEKILPKKPTIVVATPLETNRSKFKTLVSKYLQGLSEDSREKVLGMIAQSLGIELGKEYEESKYEELIAEFNELYNQDFFIEKTPCHLCDGMGCELCDSRYDSDPFPYKRLTQTEYEAGLDVVLLKFSGITFRDYMDEVKQEQIELRMKRVHREKKIR